MVVLTDDQLARPGPEGLNGAAHVTLTVSRLR